MGIRAAIKRHYGLFLSAAIVLLSVEVAHGQSRVFSYIDENGRRIVTNIPFDYSPIDAPEPASKETTKGRSERTKTPPNIANNKVIGKTHGADLAVLRAEERVRLFDQKASQSDRLAAKTDSTLHPDIKPSQEVAVPSPARTNSLLPTAPVATNPAPFPSAPIPGETEYLDSVISKYADHHGVEPDLVKAVVKAESNFDPMAVSAKGARGLMQLMPDTARRYGVQKIHDPEENIAGGVRYLKDLLDMFNGNIPLALSGYNAGENRVLRTGMVPNIAETRNYISRISRLFNFDRSPFTTDKGPLYPQQPQIRRFINSHGLLEITNVGYDR